jgi:hypothetical protein
MRLPGLRSSMRFSKSRADGETCGCQAHSSGGEASKTRSARWRLRHEQHARDAGAGLAAGRWASAAAHAARCMPPGTAPRPTSLRAGAFQLIFSVRMDFHTCCSVQSRTLSQKGNLPARQGAGGGGAQ